MKRLWLCKKDFKMITGRIVFTAGKHYEEIERISHNIEKDQWIDVFLIDDDGERHGMDLNEDMKLYFEEEKTLIDYFEKP